MYNIVKKTSYVEIQLFLDYTFLNALASKI